MALVSNEDILGIVSTETSSFSDLVLEKQDSEFWTAEVGMTAAASGIWEDDLEETIKKKISVLKKKFHSGRYLLVEELPHNVTVKEIYSLLSDFHVKSVQLQHGVATAHAVLEDPEVLDIWDQERIYCLRGQRTKVYPSPTAMVLCITHLPFNFTENQFTELVGNCGEIRYSFLMISEKTGNSKGYGFVEYASREIALSAKVILNGKIVENSILHCDWLDSSHTTFDSLHSKCLYVNSLPRDFRDMGEFRKVFSSVVNPSYCQIALKNGCPQDWGLVEYSTGDEAERTQTMLNGYNLHGSNIRICYCIPGVRAINLYLNLLNLSNEKGKKTGLLPLPPVPTIFQYLHNLAKQNSEFAQSLQNIIRTQIEAHCSGTVDQSQNVKPAYGIPEISQKVLSSGATSFFSALGSAVNSEWAAHIILQAVQEGRCHPLLAENPQMLAALQNLIRQCHGSVEQKLRSKFSISDASTLKQSPSPFPPNNSDAQKIATSTGSRSKAGIPLLSTQSVASSEEGIQGPSFMNPVMGNRLPLLPNPPIVTPQKVTPRPLFVNPVLGNELPLLQNLPIASPREVTAHPPFPHPGVGNELLLKPNLPREVIAHPPFINPVTSIGNALPLKPNKPMVSPRDITPHQPFINPVLKTSSSGKNGVGPSYVAGKVGLPIYELNVNGQNHRPVPDGNSHLSRNLFVRNENFRESLTGPDNLLHPLHSGPVHIPQSPSLSSDFSNIQPILKEPLLLQNEWTASDPFLTSPVNLPKFVEYPAPDYGPRFALPRSPPFITSPPRSAPLGFATPLRQKRKGSGWLPSPERSPEGNYIGQHSQGLGGHYADSYFKRMKYQY